MAKKVVATLQTAGKNYTKVIRMVKSSKTGAYTFKENVVHVEEVKDLLAKK
ncbi:MAG: DUF4295 domain-containing protein [Bacteroidales bacterium]